jgi:UDP-N-acetylmuramoylalanine--D-glutamate ligase
VNLTGTLVVVVGLGRSGIAAANLCINRGAKVVATDLRTRDSVGEEILSLEKRGAELCLGSHDKVPWESAQIAVVSPGVPNFPALVAFEKSGREVISEIELASRFISAPIVVIGGTNGKSTVTTWTGAMLAKGGRRVFVGGNLGTPLAEVVDEKWDIIVLEISSFQAERVPTLHPKACVLLNVTDDHLDRYVDFQAYADAKGNVFVHMNEGDIAVVPFGDEICEKQARRGKARIVTFGPSGMISAGKSHIEDTVWGNEYPIETLALQGAHNQLNACASIALASALGATHEEIAEVLANFRGLAHRTELAGEVRRIRFYDDSKGTNVGASVAALVGLKEEKAVLIAGGRDKLGSYGPLVEALRNKGRGLVVIGEAADRIEEAARGVVPIVRANSMKSAVEAAWKLAKAGDAVLLSPACSSFDMFKDYKDRGNAFCKAVAELIASEAARGIG